MSGSSYPYGSRSGSGYGRREHKTTYTLTCEPQRGLSLEDFERLNGTNVGAAMLRNRLYLAWPAGDRTYASHETVNEITKFVRETAETTTTDLYFIQRDDNGISIYLFRAADAAAMRLVLHGRTFDQTDRERMDDYNDSYGGYRDPYSRGSYYSR